MGIKLHVKFLLLLIFLPALIWGQCLDVPTSPATATITLQGSNNICSDETISFTSNVNLNGGTNETYQWEYQVGAGAWTDITGETSNSLTNYRPGPTTPIPNNSRYRLQITFCEGTSEEEIYYSNNSPTITVNNVSNATAEISSNKTEICPGEQINFTADLENQGSSPVFSWRVNNVEEGTSSSFSWDQFNDGDNVELRMTNYRVCADDLDANPGNDIVESNIIAISVKAGTPAQPSTITISDSDPFCPGGSKTYTVTNDATASEYIWTLPSGWSGSSTTNSITVTTGTTSGDITVAAKNDCGTSSPRILAVNAAPGIPNTPGTITGNTAVCPGLAETYSITAVSNASEYIWTLPNGWNGGTTSVTTNTPTLNITSGATGNNGNISVIASNSCGQSSPRTLAVTVKNETPATPGTITGDATICPGISKKYTIVPVSGATQYIWTLPSGFSAPNLTTTLPELNVTAGASGSGQITVRASNDCGTSTNPSSLTISISDPTPVMTGAIAGPTGVCANTNGHVYSIPAIANATSYSWTATGGLSITGVQTGNSITINTGSSGGTLSVIAKNSCGDSNSQSLTVSINNPAPVIPASTNISGPAKVCANSTGIQYTIPAVTNATTYTWSVPSGWNITNGQGTRTLTLNTPGTTSPNNTISVIAVNSCGSSAAKTFSVNSSNNAPSQPGAISTDLPSTSICPPVSGYKFWVTPVSGNTYNWILPAGFTITNGAGTHEITINIASNTPYGNGITVDVEAVNACGPSTRRSYNQINIDNFAYADLGADQIVCSSTNTLNLSGNIGFGTGNSKLKIQSLTSTGTNSVQNIPKGKENNFNYNYTPSSTDIANGQVTFTVTTESPAGNNNCSSQGVDQMTVFFRPVPAVTISSNSPICSGQTSTLNFSGTPDTRVTYRRGNGSDQTIDIPSSGTATITTAALTANTTYNLRSIQYLTAPNCTVSSLTDSTTVTVTQPPTATISYNGPFCITQTSVQPVNLTGTNAFAGGTFNQPAGLAIDNAGGVNPSSSAPGVYTIIYTTPASGECPAVEASTTVTINDETLITSQPVSTRACEGDDISFTVNASGQALTYQWYDGNGNAISPGGDSATLSLSDILKIDDEGDYYVMVNNSASCAPVTSNTVQLTVDQDIDIESQPVNTIACEGEIISLDVNATTGGNPLDGSFNYQWYKGNPGSGTPLANMNAASLPFNPGSPDDSGDYYVEITGSGDYTCQPVTSSVATLEIRPTPTVDVSGSTNICDGESAPLSFFNGTPNTNVNVILNGDNSNPITIALDAAGEAIYDSGALFATSDTDTDFTYSLASIAYTDIPDCSNTITGSATITVAPNPDATLSFTNDQVEFCTKDSNPYTPILTGSGNYTGGTFSSNGLSINSSNGSFTPSANSAGDYTISYTIPAYGGCTEEVATLDISIYEEVLITSEPFNLGICSTQDAEFSVVASGDNLSYQWYKVQGTPDFSSTETDDIAISGANTSILSLPVATSSDDGDYYVSIAGTNACTPTLSTQVTSEVVSLNVDEDIVIIEPAEDVRVCNDTNATVDFVFVVHANGAPLLFEWIYADGTPVEPQNQSNMETSLTQRPPTSDEISDHPELAGLQLYEGILTINNITSADQASYAIRIDGSSNNFNCPEAISNSFNLDVDPLPDAPTVENIEYCLGDTATPLTATGSNLTWYDANMVELTEAPTPDTSVFGTTSYYVTQKDSFCESPMTNITVTVHELPAAPTLSSAELYVGYCVGDSAVPLFATADSGGTINWYGPGDPDLALTEAPTPQITAAGELSYWVSQTNTNDCEGPKTQITVNIYNIPVLSITNSGDDIICEGDTITLTATDSNSNGPNTTFTWISSEDPSNPVVGAVQNFSPTANTTYTVTAENENTCTNFAEYTINVDTPPIPGTLAGPDTVCEAEPSGSLDLTGFTGNIVQWEFKAEGDADWTVINETAPDANYTFSGITQPTSYRVMVSNGVCATVYSNEISVNIDLVPVGGELLWAANNDRLFLTCENPAPGYGSALNLTGNIGQILHWEYRGVSANSWQTIDTQTNSIDPSEIESVVLNETTAFRVRIEGNSCGPDIYSATAMVSVIEADIKPAPVEVDKDVICIGDTITLSSETGYSSTGGKFDGGAFDNAALDNSNTWIFEDADGTVYNFESSANNGRANHWLRMNPHGNTEPNEKVYTAELYPIDQQGPGNGYMVNFRTFSSNAGNKGFALVTGNNDSNFETPIFSLGGLDEAILTWDQAYNLTEGAKITVEISTNGGSTYQTVLFDTIGTATSGNYDNFGDGTPATRPLNKMVIDLGAYIGMSNLRLRWRYEGTIDGDVWAVDNIQVPEGPQDILLQWYYDDDLNDPDNYLEEIGAVNQAVVDFVPKKIGWNDFEVQTRIILDSNGDECQSVDNFETIRVWAFDRYTTNVETVVGSCGSLDVQLNASVTADYQAKTITEYPTLDGYVGRWKVEDLVGNEVTTGFTIINQDSESTLDPMENPNAIFSAESLGDYNFKWILIPTAVDENGILIDNSGCPPVENPNNVILVDCTTLDFDGDNDYIDLGNSYNGNYFIEAWIRPFDRSIDGGGNTDANTGVIFSSPGFEISMDNLGSKVSKNGRWYHIAVSNTGQLWVDGIASGSITVNTPGINNTTIGARYDANTKTTSNHFSGWIDELRIWDGNSEPNLKEIRFMMNQRIKLNAAADSNTLIEGEVVPNLVIADGFSSYYTDGTHNLDQDGDRFYDQTWGDLAGYYRLYSEIPDPDNVPCFIIDDTLKPINGYTPDHSINKVPGRLVNITTNQENTSPTPYCSGTDGTWASVNTWARPAVWDYPNSSYNSTPIEWNIARVNHNITADSKRITMLGILSETPNKLLTINGNVPVRLTHYLLLDGNMDLVDESQLLQDHGSILDNTSGGWAEIDQQGRMSSFNYNYWSSPFSNQGTNNNSGFMLNQVLLDGSNPNTPQPINFRNGYFSADGAKTNPITISNEWIWDFRGGRNDDYSDWLHLGSDFLEIVGAGYSMKGTTGSVGLSATQNYVFRGKPNNGNIPSTDLNVVNGRDFLIGNPFASAIDAHEFIRDNLRDVGSGSNNGQNPNNENVFNGTIYYWDHFAGATHILAEYVGGYASYNLSGSAEAISNDWRINVTDDENTGVLPEQYIPVAQGFFITAAPVGTNTFGGDIIFKNTQRVFATESSDPSIFLQHEDDLVKGQTKNQKLEVADDTRMKIRLRYESPKKYYRQILVTMDENTTNGFDLGYDAPMIENNPEDMYWYFDEKPYVIQGVPNFDVEQILPFAIKSKEGGEFVIKIDKTENWPSDKELYLKDKVLDTVHDILATDYIGSTEIAGEINDRFEIVFFKEKAQDPVVPDPDDIVDPEDLPIIDGLVGISYSTFSKQVKISNFDLLDVSKVMIFDMGGKLIQQYDDLPTEEEILLGMRPVRSGVYIIKVFSENGISNKKVVIK
ncbi:T9SS type A sorting domain-containing protein [Gramella sp. MAR_2010_147]|uniref:Ig-like domain-containing protein n=1 Tax=Gramella sp. MAR_2010_147 TaxID=1250205 RepID=UPI00087AE8E8|nr:T9SS type A sorting domain-containing protein [Gramella sp. MAR_2010_147]SDS07993.1 Por secretion system C-terminal sorting domain-containing protein [Gramella sp. MAR_2010_147]